MSIKTTDIKRKIPGIIGSLFRYVFFLCVGYILLYPFIYLIVNSVKGIADTYDATVTWVPKSIYLGNFLSALKVFDVKNTLVNTFVFEIVSALIQFCSCAVAAYGMARFNIREKGILSVLMIASMLVPPVMLIIPNYVNFSQMDFLGILGLLSKIIGKDIRPNLIGTPWSFYLPSLLGVGIKGGLFIYIFSQFYKGMPKELEEAAEIDGAGAWRTFLSIVVPSSGSANITVLLFSVVWHWNDYYFAQMYVPEKPTFAVAINNFGENTVSAMLGLDIQSSALLSVPILLAGCLIFMIPLIVFFAVIQRKFMASIARTGLVG